MLEWILKKVVSVFSKEVWERVKNRHQNSKNASNDYNRAYEKRHGQLQVFCVGMEPSRSLDDVYVVVQFLAKRKATKHNSTEEVGKVFLQKGRGYFTSTSGKRQGGIRIATNEQYLMVLGGPGVGKSTFLRKVGLEALKGEDGNLEHQCIPVFLELRRFTKDPIDIKAWIINEFKVCGYPYPELIANAKLEAGELLVLFDGLDEVPKPDLSNVINKIRDFVHQYSQNRFIASCRVGAYKGEFTDFTEVEIADFDDSQIQDYINKQFASPSNRKMKTAQRCWQALNDPEHQAIKELAQNPLSLALLCQVYEDSQDFPSSETILYGKILNIFLKKWTAEKHVHRDPPMSPYLAIPTVKELLSEIAAENFKANCLVFTEDELTDQIQEFYQRRIDISSRFDASKILEAILVDPGLLVERANGIYTFFHLTFQEYLTANHIVRNPCSCSIQGLVNQHSHDEGWREVFLLTAGLMRKADDLLVAMEAEAAKCIKTDRLKALFQWTKQVTDTPDSQDDKITKPIFAIHQYLSLRLLNEIYKTIENDVTQYSSSNQDSRNLYSGTQLDRLFDQGTTDRLRELYQTIALIGREMNCINDYFRFDRERYRYRELEIYFEYYPKFWTYRYPYLYQDIYKYTDVNCYSIVPSQLPETSIFAPSSFGEDLIKELELRVQAFKSIEEMRIFKDVDLQKMIRRFKEQQEFIKAVMEGESIEPPGESIHDTWLAVLGITDDMLAISEEELENCYRYLRAVELILACKEAAGRVSPEVWQKIEEKLLT